MSSSTDYVRDLTKLGYSFRYNEVTDRVEVNHEPISDILAAQIRTRMRDAGHRHMAEVEDAYTAAAWQDRYHPIREYLTGLQWDGQPNIDKLAGYITDRHGMLSVYLRRWLIGAVAKVFTRTQNFMLVLSGEQGSGKSYLAGWLCPAALTAYYVEGAIDTNDKDVWRRAVVKWLWEVGEFGATTRRADHEALKDFISRIEVTIRPPYGKHDITRPSLASMIGTINNEGTGFLNDSSGSRRFGVVEIAALDWGYTALDVNQIWAEAFTAWQGGERWELTTTERAQQAVINEEYEMESSLEGFLRKYYTLDPQGDDWESGVNIIQELEIYGLKGFQVAALRELARVLRKDGHERKRIKGVWSYRGVSRKAMGVVI